MKTQPRSEAFKLAMEAIALARGALDKLESVANELQRLNSAQKMKAKRRLPPRV